MLTVGFGTTVLSRGVKRNHIDGIGVYTKELLASINQLREAKLVPMVFGAANQEVFDSSELIENNFYSHLLKNQLWGHKVLIPSHIDVVHATDNHIPFVKNKPVIATIFDLIPLIHPEWLRSRLSQFKVHYFKKSILACNHYITISEFSKQDMVKHLNIPESNISVTPLGVNQDFFNRIDSQIVDETLKRLGIFTSYFLFVGTLQPRKNIEGMLEAHALLSPQDRKDYPIVLVGNIGTASPKLLELISESEKHGFVKWLKYLSNIEVKALLQRAIAMIYVSLYEGFGLPVVEAFASQCPVISSNTTSIPEVAGDAALLVNPREYMQIAEAMKTMIHDAYYRQELIVRGLARAQQFTWTECAKKTSDVYEKFK